MDREEPSMNTHSDWRVRGGGWCGRNLHGTGSVKIVRSGYRSGADTFHLTASSVA